VRARTVSDGGFEATGSDSVIDWGHTMGVDAMAATAGGPEVEIELVGPHLRVGGRVALGRFHRLSDRVNHGRGFILIHDARLLKRNGDPTPLVVRELYVNQDEVTFIAMIRATDTIVAAPADANDRPLILKQARRQVVFTPGHVISGLMHVYEEMTLAGLVDSTDPRFLPMTQVSARSLADRRVVSHFELLLVNRTQMTAVAEAPGGETEAPAVEIS
jgi:hypothetical protein